MQPRLICRSKRLSCHDEKQNTPPRFFCNLTRQVPSHKGFFNNSINDQSVASISTFIGFSGRHRAPNSISLITLNVFFIQRFNLEASRAAVRVRETLVSPRDSSCTSGAAGFERSKSGAAATALYQRNRANILLHGPGSIIRQPLPMAADGGAPRLLSPTKIIQCGAKPANRRIVPRVRGTAFPDSGSHNPSNTGVSGSMSVQSSGINVGNVGGPGSPSLRACTAIQRHVHCEANVTVSCQSGCGEYIACAARRGLTRAVAVTQNTAGQTSESLQAVAPVHVASCWFGVRNGVAQWRGGRVA